MKKRIVILGSTGSIGTSTLKVIKNLPDHFEVAGLAAHSNIDLLQEQVEEFSPKVVAVYDEKKASELKRRCSSVSVIGGMEGVKEAASRHDADLVISAMSGTLGLIPTVTAIEAGKDVALANKEALVSGGALVMDLVHEKGVRLLPIDSEHSAIFQCLNGEKKEAIRRIILTSSGGPFRNYTESELQKVTTESALNHPTWSMGPKVTVDSSTLMNKGLEVIEAKWLFDLAIDQIDVVIHPQSIVHSMVEFIDFSIIAQMGEPNMVVPIQYAMTYPKRERGFMQPFDFEKFGKLEFYKPDTKRFRCLNLAFESIKTGGTMPCFMNAANEVLVNRFLKKEISWNQISEILENLMEKHEVLKTNSLRDVLDVDAQARELALKA